MKLPIMPGGVPNTDTYIEMMDYIIQTMVDAAQQTNKPWQAGCPTCSAQARQNRLP